MKITNKMNLPQAIVNAVTTEQHNAPGTVSATTLLKGNKHILLMQRHWDEIETDAADMIWAIFGTAVHAVMEAQVQGHHFSEEFLSYAAGSLTVTGRIDLYDMTTGTIDDYKTASLWKVVYQDFEDWRKQGLIYAWLLRKNGMPANHVRFIALLKDHSKRKARYDASYPQSPVYTYEYHVTENDIAEIDAFIMDKVKSLSTDMLKLDDEIEPCSMDQRWQDYPKFALMKEGRKSAVRLYDTAEDAMAALDNADSKHYLQARPGEPIMCLDYCPAKQFCSFYKEYTNGTK